jgi:hypothetical protein
VKKNKMKKKLIFHSGVEGKKEKKKQFSNLKTSGERERE